MQIRGMLEMEADVEQDPHIRDPPEASNDMYHVMICGDLNMVCQHDWCNKANASHHPLPHKLHLSNVRLN